jgi:hypothetical protein
MVRYNAAAVCRRGHRINPTLQEPTGGMSVSVSDSQPAWPEVPQFCPECGTSVLTRCESCSSPIKGLPQARTRFMNYEPPAFCEACASPYPWLDRQGRIYLLQNMLDEERLDPATRLEVKEQLEVLADPTLGEEEQAAGWENVKRLAPTLWERSGAQRILVTVVSAALKQRFDLDH